MMDWQGLRGMRRGETCTIIGNGPSLRNVPDAFLDRFDTFGSNRVYLKYVPTFYAAVNPLVIQQFIGDIITMACSAKFIRAEYSGWVPGAYPIRDVGKSFSLTPWHGVYEGHTVTFVCLQLAHFIGYRRVFLVGVDHRYQYTGKPNALTYMDGDDPNHFDPSYFRGAQWHNPDLERSREAYILARDAFGPGNIINLTPNTALDVFERGDLGTV